MTELNRSEKPAVGGVHREQDGSLSAPLQAVSIEDEIQITIHPFLRSEYRGTWAQLVDEKLIPAKTEQLAGRQPTKWQRGDFVFELYRCQRSSRVALGDFWRCNVEPSERTPFTSKWWFETERRDLDERERVFLRDQLHTTYARIVGTREDKTLQAMLCLLKPKRGPKVVRASGIDAAD